MTLEKEEQERKELQKMIMGEDDKDGDKKKATKKEDDENSQFGFGTPGLWDVIPFQFWLTHFLLTLCVQVIAHRRMKKCKPLFYRSFIAHYSHLQDWGWKRIHTHRDCQENSCH